MGKRKTRRRTRRTRRKRRTLRKTKRRRTRKNRRTRRRGGSSNPAVMALVDIFYNPPANVKPGKTKNGLGPDNWESQWVKLSNDLRCYLGNMEKHKMDRKNYIKNGKGFMMNKKKRKTSWDACKHNKGPDHSLALQYFMRHGFDHPKLDNLDRAELEKVMMTKRPTREELIEKLKNEKYFYDIEIRRSQ